MRLDDDGRPDQRRRNLLALCASGGLHLALLLDFVWVTPAIHAVEPPTQPSVEVDLVAPPEALPSSLIAPNVVEPKSVRATPSNTQARLHRIAPAAIARAPAPTPPRPTPLRSAFPRPAPTRPARLPAPSPPASAGPTTPSRRPAAAAGPASSAPARGEMAGSGLAAGPYAGEDANGDVRGFLRATVGCSHQDYLHLNHAERDECHRQFGAAGTKVAGRVDAIPAGKRAYYDAVQQAYRDIRDYSALGHPPGNGLSAGCSKGKCGVNLPSGVLTEESDIPPPESPPH